MITLYQFAKDSNEIERIYDEVRHNEHKVALMRFLTLPAITIPDLEDFVKTIEPEHILRRSREDRVFIGGREAPRAPKSLALLEKLLGNINDRPILPWSAHAEYECIHPFTDGNGRSGRALWLWMMHKNYGEHALYYPFLQWYYYQTLANYSENRSLQNPPPASSSQVKSKIGPLRSSKDAIIPNIGDAYIDFKLGLQNIHEEIRDGLYMDMSERMVKPAGN